jgi:hypothetical protein
LSTTPLGTIRLDRDTVAGQAPPEDSGSLIKFSGAQCHLDTSDAEGYALFCALRHPMTTSRRITFGKLRCIVCV